MAGKSGALLNYTTIIDPARTVGEIMGMLATHGARKIQTEYENGRMSGLAFSIDIGGRELGFRLPVQARAVLEKLKEQRQSGTIRVFPDMERAEKVAWRILKDWVEAQIALIETGMVKTEEVFLPYLLTDGEHTLFEKMQNSRFLLPEPKSGEGAT